MRVFVTPSRLLIPRLRSRLGCRHRVPWLVVGCHQFGDEGGRIDIESLSLVCPWHYRVLLSIRADNPVNLHPSAIGEEGTGVDDFFTIPCETLEQFLEVSVRSEESGTSEVVERLSTEAGFCPCEDILAELFQDVVATLCILEEEAHGIWMMLLELKARCGSQSSPAFESLLLAMSRIKAQTDS